jgi:uncharacterized membrane protein YfcA
MAIFLVLPFAALTALYFGLIRLAESRKKEYLQFLTMYAFLLLLVFCLHGLAFPTTGRGGGSILAGFLLHAFQSVTGIQADIENRGIALIYRIVVVGLYYLCPTFLVSYLLYPFRNVRRKKALILIPAVLSVLVPGAGLVLTVLVGGLMH